jgi:C4-dicarboxylate transporter, DctM subunit
MPSSEYAAEGAVTNKGGIAGLATWVGKAIDRLSDLSGTLSGILLLGCAAIAFWQVVARRVLGRPTHWEPDVTVYLLIWIGFLAAGYGLKEGSHVIVDSLVEHLRPKARAALEVLAYFLVAAYAFLFTLYAVRMTVHSFQLHEVAFTQFRMAIAPVKLGVPVGMGILTLQALRMFVQRWRTFYEMRNRAEEGSLAGCALVVSGFVVSIGLSVWLFGLYPLVGSILLLSAVLAAGIPVGFTLGIVGCTGLLLLFGSDQALINMPVLGFSQLNSFTLVALPLFLIAGLIVKAGGLADKLLDVAAAFVGHLPGGLGIATIAACAVFAAIAGSSVACAAAVGSAAIPLLIKKGYDRKFVCGIVAGGGTLGILMPPASQMIVYAVLTEESLGRLFMAGLIPGIILAAMFATYISIKCRRSGDYGRVPRVPWKQKLQVVKGSAFGLAMPAIILTLIYSGVVYATEAAAFAVIYSLGLSLANKSIRWRDLLTVLRESGKTTTMMFMMIIGSFVLGGMASMLQFTQEMVETVVSSNLPVWLVIVLLMVFLIVVGTYLEPIAIMFLFVPIAAPVLKSLGVDLIWFAVILAVNMEMAIISPPVGTNMNVVQQISGASYTDVNRGVIPFILIMAVAMILFGLVPQLSLWLPSTMGR